MMAPPFQPTPSRSDWAWARPRGRLAAPVVASMAMPASAMLSPCWPTTCSAGVMLSCAQAQKWLKTHDRDKSAHC